MKRREAIKNTVFLIGGVVSFTSLGILGSSCSFSGNRKTSLKEHEQLIEDLVDTFVPATNIPGAKEAEVGPFVILMVSDCYPEKSQRAFLEGLNQVQQEVERNKKIKFSELTSAQKADVLKAVEASSPEFMRLIVQLTNLGYFTSEIGATQALSFNFTPGRYDGCMPMTDTQKAWAM